MTGVYILLLITIGLAGFAAWKMSQAVRGGADPAELSRLRNELQQALEGAGRFEAQLRETQSKRDELAGKNKGMFVEVTELKAAVRSLTGDKEKLEKRVTKFETEAQQRADEHRASIQQLSVAKQGYEDEKTRIRKEDLERLAREEANRDRIWAEHEKNVIATLAELCKQPQYSFSCYTNTNLPPDFMDGSLKPDFMIDFLGQYVIFDAKKSKSESLQTYMNNTIKKTVQKVKNNDKIAPFIYLVVPSEAIGELKSHYYVHDGFTLYVISAEALAPILAGLKKITKYEFVEQMDPQQRENIVQLIAELDFHINLRNAADILLTKMGSDLLEKAQRSDPKLAEEVAVKKQPMNAKASIAAQDLKKLVSQLTLQNTEMKKLVSPRAAVQQAMLQDTAAVLQEAVS